LGCAFDTKLLDNFICMMDQLPPRPYTLIECTKNHRNSAVEHYL